MRGGITALAALILLLLFPMTPAAASSPPVVLIVMENHSFDASDPGGVIGTPGYIVGNSDAPYINGTLIPQGTLFSNYYSTTHPSLPAYIDMTAGQHGSCTDDVTCARDSLTFDNLFQLLGKAGIAFASYVQSMPANCSLTSTDVYSVDHNPEAYLADVDAASGLPYDCPATDVPFPTDWATLPAFSLVVPDRCHDMEGSAPSGPCPKKTDAIITAGDTWLSQTVPTLVSTGADVIVVFDEATGGDKRSGGGHVLAVEVGPGVVSGSSDGTFYNHFSLLSGLEGRFGLTPLLGGAAIATPPLPIPGAAPATPPTITDVQPNMGAPGDLVTISGTGFSSTYAVRFNGLDAAFDVGNDNSITATVPISASSGPISVAVPGATVASPSTFTVTTSEPGLAITSFSPTSGAARNPGDHRWKRVRLDDRCLVRRDVRVVHGDLRYPAGCDRAVHRVVWADHGDDDGRLGDELGLVHRHGDGQDGERHDRR